MPTAHSNELITPSKRARLIHRANYDSPLGPLTLAATDHGLCGLYFEAHKYLPDGAGWMHTPQQTHLVAAATQLDAYFAGRLRHFTLPLDLGGTPFQSSVWRALLEIDYGCTTSYGKHAQQIGAPQAVRAVGSAIGRNPVSIVVPCHRVVGRNGALSGYAGGLERKRLLLALERRTQDLM